MASELRVQMGLEKGLEVIGKQQVDAFLEIHRVRFPRKSRKGHVKKRLSRQDSFASFLPSNANAKDHLIDV